MSALASGFKDVKAPSWYSNSVSYAVENGYMAGMGNDMFAPEGLVTRAQLTQILYATEEKPEVKEVSPFTDIPTSGKWYSSAVLWGAEKGIVAGYPDKAFRPNQPVTREQLVSVMYKYAAFKKYIDKNDSGAMGLAGFSDADKVANYARPGMLWAVQNGIISGTKIGLEPKGVATRAQMAVIIHAFITKVAEPAKDSNNSGKDQAEEDLAPEDPADSSPDSVTPSAKPNEKDISADDPMDSTVLTGDNESSENDNHGSSSAEDPVPSPSTSPSPANDSAPMEDEGPFVPISLT